MVFTTNVIIFCSDFREEWAKLKTKVEAEIAEEEKQAKTQGGDKMIMEVGVGRELSDIYLRHPANESSSDSEGEEADVKTADDEEIETFRKVMEQQKELQIKRAKEAEEKKKKAEET